MRHTMGIPRWAGLAAPAVAGALLLAACGSSGSSSAKAGSASSGGGGGAKTYTIACQGPLTGDNAQLGINICDGAQLAINQANATGSLPFKLKYMGVDDQGTAAQGPVAAQKVIGDSSTVAVVGPAFSGATQASESFYTQADMASVTASATKPSLTDASNGFKTFFRAVANDSAQGAGAAAYIAAKLHAKKVYSIDDAEAYGQGLATVLEGALKDKNVPFVHDSVPQGTKQYEPVAGKVVSSGADVVYYSGYYADAGPLAKALRQAGFKGTFMSDDGTKDPNFIKLAGANNAEGAYFTCPCVDASQNPKSASFVTAYKAAFNTDPGTYSAEAFDAANAIIAAMKTINGAITRSALVAAVRNVDYQGITKEIKFGSNGELSSSAVYLYQVKNGAIAFLGPVNQLAGS